jgi:hypothetical protein
MVWDFPLFHLYMGFFSVSWYQMHDGSEQFCKANDIEMPFY